MSPSATRNLNAGAVPATILEDAALNACIDALLPRTYSFEIHKTIHQIRFYRCSMVALQMPEGLTLWSTAICDIIERFTEAGTLIMGDVTYGACCVDDYTARALGADLLIHYGHSCLVPVDQTSIRTLYVFVEIAIDAAHLASTVRANFPSSREEFRRRILSDKIQSDPSAATSSRSVRHVDVQLEAEGSAREEDAKLKIAMVGTVQFIAALQGLKEDLEEPWPTEDFAQGSTPRLAIEGSTSAHQQDSSSSSSIAPSTSINSYPSPPRYDRGAYAPLIPQIRPLSPGEILGCTSPVLPADTDLVLYVGDGRFHLESVMIANPRIPAFRFDPYDRVFVREFYDHERMRKDRSDAVKMARAGTATVSASRRKAEAPSIQLGGESDTVQAATQVVQQPKAAGWGVILGTLGRQGSLSVLSNISTILSQSSRCIPVVPILLSELSPAKLALFGPHLDAFVQSSCPRLSIDWGSAFEKPLLSPYEAAVAVDKTRGWDEIRGEGVGMVGAEKASRAVQEVRVPSLAPPNQGAHAIDSEEREASENNRDGTEGLRSGSEADYPMDFYADDSRGPWTPRHGMAVKKRSTAQKGGLSNKALLRKAAAARAQAQAQTQTQTQTRTSPSNQAV
ncbi:Diphthamide biosynthesis protein [Ceraceosorus bombacis]|uniref:2-(3-amino-3-carboxypropyl)histidine synthase subunit 1 n=1 Tax=Ceraceosorus bombacis TaxID=401625 RepID=A0A0P1BF68_9BASI|nr:Diphthamide biosynthesis protein [Ceraceosorus bombacis]